jgi:magnesium chelatase subunit I
MPNNEYVKLLNSISGLKELTQRFLPGAGDMSPLQLAVGMEFVLDGMHQNSMLSRDEMGLVRTYSDMIKKMFSNISREDENDEEEI